MLSSTSSVQVVPRSRVHVDEGRRCCRLEVIQVLIAYLELQEAHVALRCMDHKHTVTLSAGRLLYIQIDGCAVPPVVELSGGVS